MKKDYYLGLDVGTSSCGWAVTDFEYNLMRAKGKDLWGVRLFNTAKTAKTRRVFRSSRRRIARRNERIKLLQELLSDIVLKNDPYFFLRLNESELRVDDKNANLNHSSTNLFPTKAEEKAFYQRFPTIYHLRNALQNDESGVFDDPRLLYLACHHVLKYRGNFLFEGKGFDFNSIGGEGEFFDAVNDFNVFYRSFFQIENDLLDRDSALKLYEVIIAKKTKTDKKREIKELASSVCDDKTQQEVIKAFAEMVIGSLVSLSRILVDSEDFAEDIKIDFNKNSFLEEYSDLSTLLMENMVPIDAAKKVFDAILLSTILKDGKGLSQSMVDVYDKHKIDLAKLKSIFKKYFSREEYYDFFVKTTEKANYSAYVGSSRKKDVSKCSYSDFLKYLRKILTSKDGEIKNDNNYLEIIREIDLENFLPRIGALNNTAIPYQVHEFELKTILQYARRYYPILDKKDEYNLSVIDKILSIVGYRIPYYVGPLKKQANHQFAWIARRSNEKIYPWNFDRIVNLEQSQINFIERLTNRCSFLINEDVLPANSLLYSKYLVLDELNNTFIKGNRINQKEKEVIFQKLFLVKRKVGIKAVVNVLNRECGYSLEENDVLLQNRESSFTHSLNSFHDFKRILGDNFDSDFAEKAIFYLTVFPEGKATIDLLRRDSKIKYEDKIYNDISKLKYTGWGRLSRQFLDGGITAFDQNGEIIPVIKLLENETDSLMQVLNDARYNFKEQIVQYNGVSEKTSVYYSDLVDSYISPVVRKPIWQALRIVKELRSVLKHDPSKIFIEVTREPDEKKKGQKTKSRREIIKETYKAIDEQATGVKSLGKELDSYTDEQLRSEVLYLYFIQLGRCMYSGKKIDVSDLFNSNLYDVDHIIPQSLRADDSLDNKVLVEKNLNQNVKKHFYPLPVQLRSGENQQYWKMLLDRKLLTKEKYSRLTRTNPLSENELNDFINRQLVSTNQAVKVLGEFLGRLFPSTKIVFSKARNVSKFREEFDIIKVREANDLHHAHDAYLNIVVGNVLDVKFSARNEIIKKVKEIQESSNGENNASLNVMRAFKYEQKNTWNPKTHLKTIRQNVYENFFPLVTHQTDVETDAFYELQKVKKASALVPQKESGPKSKTTDGRSEYGGYNAAATAFFIAVSYLDAKGKQINTLLEVPIMYAERFKNSAINVKFLLERSVGVENVDKVISRNLICIEKYSRLRINDFDYYITGKTGVRFVVNPASQQFWSKNELMHIKMILSFLNKNPDAPSYINEELEKVYHRNNRLNLNPVYITKEQNEDFYDLVIEKLNSGIYRNTSRSSFVPLLRDNKEVFKQMNIYEQMKMIKELLKIFNVGISSTFNLLPLGGSKNAGKLLFSLKEKNIVKIDESVTGLFRKETKIQ